jgi:hypothetical protein
MDKEINNSSYIDSLDDGFAYDDGDGTTSIHLFTGILYNNEIWNQFMGGSHAGEAPSKTNIVATEDLLYYTLATDNSLEAYSHLTGDVWPVDLWTWTSFTNGSLAGETLASVINGTSTKGRFLGIASDVLVVESCNPVATIKVENRTPQGDLGAGLFEVKVDCADNAYDAIYSLAGSGSTSFSYPANVAASCIITQNTTPLQSKLFTTKL